MSFDQNRLVLELWLKTPGAAVAIAAALKIADETINELNKARQVPCHAMHEPMMLR